MDKVTTETVSTNHNLFEEKGEPKRYRTESPSAYQPNALPLGQTGSRGDARPASPNNILNRLSPALHQL